MEGRRIFAELTVEERSGHQRFHTTRSYRGEPSLDRILDLFPVCLSATNLSPGYLSGGRQQMLAIGRALMAKPRLLLLDEPSLGLAPQIIEDVRDLILQTTAKAFPRSLPSRMRRWHFRLPHTATSTAGASPEGARDNLVANPFVREHYLAVVEAERHSYRELARDLRRERIMP